ncbi:MAG: hypothetical protein Q8L66_13740 [Caulobacter sp.]|nr:hypothetical protein [Caulobacter sp.]
MTRIVWFLPACTALLLAGVLKALGPHTPSVRIASLALVMMCLGLALWAQRRAPPPMRGLGLAGASVIVGVIFLATLAAIVFVPMLKS